MDRQFAYKVIEDVRTEEGWGGKSEQWKETYNEEPFDRNHQYAKTSVDVGVCGRACMGVS